MNWYRVEFYSNKESVYYQAQDDEDAISFMPAWADRDDVMSVYRCNDDECLTDNKCVYPVQ